MKGNTYRFASFLLLLPDDKQRVGVEFAPRFGEEAPQSFSARLRASAQLSIFSQCYGDFPYATPSCLETSTPLFLLKCFCYPPLCSKTRPGFL